MDQGDFVKTSSAPNSTTKKGRDPVDTILKTGGWRSMKTFGRSYEARKISKKLCTLFGSFPV